MTGRYKVVNPNNEPVFVEYIENTGSNWIQTDIADSTNMSVECDVRITKPFNGSVAWLVGCYAGIGFGIYSGNYLMIIPNLTSSISTVSGKRYNVKIFRDGSNRRCATINGRTITSDINSNTYPLSIFGQQQYIDAYGAYHPGKIYSLKVYRGTTLSYDLRPCLSRESGHIDEPALYDTINKKYYYNKSTGTFNVGQKIIKSSYRIVDPSVPVFVEYIQSTGTQYIDPELPANSVGNLEEVDIDFNWTSFNSGSGQPTIMNFYGVQFYESGSTLRIWHESLGSKSLGIIEINHRYKSYIRRQVGGEIQAKLDDGSLITLGNTPASVPHPVYLFTWEPISNYFPSLIKLYGCKFTRNGNVIRDLRPCISREDGHINEPALYDTINKKYYYNKGTGTFLTGAHMRASRKLILFPPDLREWIQMPPGTGYFSLKDVLIDTKLKNIGLKFKFKQYGNSSNYTNIIGKNPWGDTGVASTRCKTLGILTNNTGNSHILWYQYSNSGYSISSSNVGTDTDCIIELGPNVAKLNGSNVSLITVPNALEQVGYVLIGGGENGRTLRFYWIEIYEWGKLIRDLRPCLSTEPGHIDEPALYDMITNKYYYNSGTGTISGTFSVGNKI